MNSTIATTTHSQSKSHSETFEKTSHHSYNWYSLLNIIQFINKMKQINTHTLLSPDDIDISIEKIKTQRNTPRISSRIKKKKRRRKIRKRKISSQKRLRIIQKNQVMNKYNILCTFLFEFF